MVMYYERKQGKWIEGDLIAPSSYYADILELDENFSEEHIPRVNEQVLRNSTEQSHYRPRK
jgi:hypothetical protein